MGKNKGEPRHRKKPTDSGHSNSQISSHSSTHNQSVPPQIKFRSKSKRKSDGNLFSRLNWNKSSALFSSIGLVLVVLGSVIYLGYNWYLRDLVKRPISLPVVVTPNSTNSELFWGTYRPQLYFGMRHMSPHSLLAGLMWFRQGELPPKIRHWCESGDNLKSYSWLLHDGRHFGKQMIVDDHHIINTTFVKRIRGRYGGDWTARISASPRTKRDNEETVSLMFYFMLPDHTRGYMEPEIEGSVLKSIRGETLELGNFHISFHTSPATTRNQQSQRLVRYLIQHAVREDRIHDAVIRGMGVAGEKRIALAGSIPLNQQDGRGGNRGSGPLKENLWVVQLSMPGESQLEVVFESIGGNMDEVRSPLVGAEFDRMFNLYKDEFDSKFSKVLPIDAKKRSEKRISQGKSVLSNMLGGIGYFYGSSLVISEHTEPHPVEYWPAPLFSATPSRPIFPRGFLWDEGFHHLLIGKWDPELVISSISYWLDLMNAEGWIPREQILGWEARAKVPDEFVVQNNKNGNPPTLILALEDLLERLNDSELQNYHIFLERAFPRLEAWFNWFNTTQRGSLPTSYRWRGRKENQKQINPLTLSSGLDDYPRASHPTEDERHLDLRCWMTVFSRVMARLAAALKLSGTASRYESWANILSDESGLEELHWNTEKKQFADYGLHTDKVILVRPQLPPNKQHLAHQPGVMDKIRHVQDAPRLQYVPSFGYVSLFPFLLRLLSPSSPRLHQVLQDLANEKLLWTKYGLRSLARTAPLYSKHNTEHDPPYWRGAIWLNMNYLAVRALRHYASVSGPNQNMALQLQNRLRENLISSVLDEYERTGYLWEQYDDTTGRGQRAHPFCGWTGLIALILADG